LHAKVKLDWFSLAEMQSPSNFMDTRQRLRFAKNLPLYCAWN
jgi:hypothetical protein